MLGSARSGMQVPGEGIVKADEYAVRAGDLFVGVLADVAEEEIEQAVVVVVEEDRAGRVARRSRRPAALEMSRKWPWPSFSNSTLPPRTVVTKRSWSPSLSMSANEADDADPAGHRDAGLRGDVLELAAAEVLPELVAADLVDEVDVGQAVAVDVRHRDAVAVIVVDRLVVLPGVVDDVVHEGDAALG